MSNPGKVTHSEDACHFHEEVLPTDDMSYTLMSKGLKRRLGTEANKSQALRFAHIKFLDQQFREEYQAAKTWEQKHEAAAAGFAAHLVEEPRRVQFRMGRPTSSKARRREEARAGRTPGVHWSLNA